MSVLTFAQIKAIAPTALSAIATGMADTADTIFNKYNLNTRLRICHFLAQVAEETGGFTVLEEDLNYSAERAHEVWPGIFRTVEMAVPYADNPMALAEKVYGGLYGNTAPGDGWKYRGQGLLQTTFKGNFALLQHLTGLLLVDQPSLITSPQYALECAVAHFVNFSGILAACDRDDLNTVTRLVNGGLTNLATRQLYLNHAKAIITSVDFSANNPPVTVTTVPVNYDTKWLQNTLNQAGAKPPLTVDNIPGPATQAALTEFQKSHNLVPDGVFGPKTQAVLEQLLQTNA